MLRELRFAFRSLLRTPGFTSAALLILALGIGATSGVFALVKAVLLEALPYESPERLVLLRGEMRREGVQPGFPLSYLDIQALDGQRRIFTEAVPVTGARPFNLNAGTAAENVTGELTGPGYLRVLGVQTALGRMFTEEEARAPGTRVIVLSHDLWQRRFGGRTDVLGSTMHLNELPYTIIGVAAPGFRGVSDGAQFFLPIGLSHALYGPHYTELRPFRWLSAVARLQPGVTIEQVNTSLGSMAQQLALDFPADNDRFGYTPTPLPESFFGSLRTPLWSLLAAAAFVLLIACANVANLLLARSSARRREFAVRVALGAGAPRLVRQVLNESLVLVAVAALAGLLVASLTARFMVASGAISLASFTTVRIDPLVILATVGAALLCAVLFGLVPAISATRVAPLEGLKDGGKVTFGRGRRAFQQILVVSQVALALTLLAGAGLMSKGFRHFLGTDLGFKADSLLTLRADLTAERYAGNEQVWQLLRQLREEGAALPGVRSIELEGPGHPTGGWYMIHLRTSETAATSDAVGARRHHVSPGYFSALGIPRLAGREFTMQDAGATPRVAIVSRSFAQRAWPGQNPVGKLLFTVGASPISVTVVGMVGDVEHSGLQSGGLPQVDVYLSIFQSPPRSPATLTLYARTAAAGGNTVPALQKLLERLDPNLAFYDVQTVGARLEAQTATARFLVRLVSGFALLGLLLAAVGIYAVIAYTVAQRTREIGIRMALGARRTQVIGHVLRQALAGVAAGNIAGLLAVFYLQRFITSLLYGVSPFDPVILAGTATLLVAVAIAASWLPALRAARAEPGMVLRRE